jgi:two-component system nitrogen regulation response regulator GlnG
VAIRTDQGMRVLVADDEPSIRFVLRETLESEGHEVSEVEDGQSAIDALSVGGYDLAFLDIRMPELSGLEVLDHLRGIGGTTAVVIITAQNTLDNAVEAMKRGALDYLVKPFGVAEVKALVSKALVVMIPVGLPGPFPPNDPGQQG